MRKLLFLFLFAAIHLPLLSTEIIVSELAQEKSEIREQNFTPFMSDPESDAFMKKASQESKIMPLYWEVGIDGQERGIMIKAKAGLEWSISRTKTLEDFLKKHQENGERGFLLVTVSKFTDAKARDIYSGVWLASNTLKYAETFLNKYGISKPQVKE